MPQIRLPIFDAGRLVASLDYAELQKDIGVADCAKSIQVAFRKAVDGLATRQTFSAPLKAEQDLVDSNRHDLELADQRYRACANSDLTVLDAQRALLDEQQQQFGSRLDQLLSEIALYTALGDGDWRQGAGGERCSHTRRWAPTPWPEVATARPLTAPAPWTEYTECARDNKEKTLKNIKFAYASLLALLSLLWWMADPLLPNGYEYFALRTVLINYTGVIGIGVMSVGMILALRPVRIEPLLDGLDKTYRLHKWLGITGLVVSVIHWLWAQGTKWAVGWGWLVKPERGPRPELTDPVEIFFRAQRGLAESVGEWAFYAAVALIVIALVKHFPYRLFFKTHRLLALAYLALVFHSVLLTPFGYWTQPMGVVLAMLMAGGSVAAVVSLSGRVGHRRKAVGEIEELVNFPENRVLKVAIRFKDRWPGHQAGQFAFANFSTDEGAHPFTISSSWSDDGRLFFLIKGIGDYTARLPELLRLGDLVTVEGPYGRFDFASGKRRQIWVGGGIGITPFIARMKALAVTPDGRNVDLFYSTAEPDESFIERLQRDAHAAGVNLHVLVTARDGRLDVERICSAVPAWAEADIWFCGPGGFGQALRAGFVAKGLTAEDFHQELFDMR